MEEKKKWQKPLLVGFSMIFLIVLVHFGQEMEWYFVKQYGMRPKKIEGLLGILSMHFLHSDWAHVWGNSSALIVLIFCLFYFYHEIAWKTFISIAIIGSFWLWIAGQYGSNHIGASGLVYGLAAFLFVSGIIRKNQNLLGIALLVTFLYGSFFWGVLPIEINIAKNISWEGHLFGAFAGVAMAFYFRKDGPQRKIYQYEIDEMLEEQELKRIEELQKILDEQKSNVKIIYHYKKEADKTDDHDQNE